MRWTGGATAVLTAVVALSGGCSSSDATYDRCTSDPEANPCVLNKAACCGCWGNAPCPEDVPADLQPEPDAGAAQGDANDPGSEASADAGHDDAPAAGDASSKDAGGGDAPSADASPDVAIVDAGPCDGGPLYTHEDGLGQSWQDCAPGGTYSLNEATQACEAYNAYATSDGHAGSCVLNTQLCSTGDAAICYAAPNTEGYCWDYQGPDVGRIVLSNCSTAGTWQ